MSYLVVKNDTERKSYSLTDQWETKPYLKVKDGKNVEGILPLTTDIEYTTLTSTYISSSSDSEGMSNITYLTCESTSGTSYLTESVAANPYLSIHTIYKQTLNDSQTATTQGMPSYKHTITYTQTDVRLWSNITRTSMFYSNTNSSTVRFSANTSGSSSRIQSGTNQGTVINTTYTYKVASSTQLTLINTTSSKTGNGAGYTTTSAKVGNSLRYSLITTYKTNYNLSYLKGLSQISTEAVTVYFSGTSSVSTTGTSYLTRESTSGYSGVLSSTYTDYAALKLINKINDSTYRAKYFDIETGSFYTSAEQSEGMYSTTALTRESTSETIYHTTSTGTVPFVDVITTYCYTNSHTYYATTSGMYDGTDKVTCSVTYTNRYNGVTDFKTTLSKNSWLTISFIATGSRDYSLSSYITNNHTGYPGSGQTISSTFSTSSYGAYRQTITFATSGWWNGSSTYGGTWYSSSITRIKSNDGSNDVYEMKTSGKQSQANAEYMNTYYRTSYPYGTKTIYYNVNSTVTTTSTEYVTRESTSGYSGVSSTSSGTWI